MARSSRLLLSLACCLCLIQESKTFSPRRIERCRPFQRPRPHCHHDESFRRQIFASSSDDAESASLSSEPKSQMNQFIANFLQQQQNADDESPSDSSSTSSSSSSTAFTPTHLIALPVDACHELTIELESVQRAILYHAPILVHACIVPAKMRLPLLYVKRIHNNNSQGSSETSRHLATLVEQVVRRHVLRDEEGQDEASAQSKPLLLEFAKLEIDGSNNAMLSTVAQPPRQNDDTAAVADDSTTNSYHQLLQLVQDLEQTLQQAGYQTSVPQNEAQRMTSLNDDDDDESANSFRPRIPFMRLPYNWNQLVQENNNRLHNRTISAETSDEDDDIDDDVPFIPSELGGNGISPIFWGKWMDDTFAKTVRMRRVAIYPRRQQRSLQDENGGVAGSAIDTRSVPRQLIDDDAFYLPERFVDLPVGNHALTKAEKEFEDYQEQRFMELEQQLQREYEARNDDGQRGDEVDAIDTSVNVVDPLLAKTRDRLEKLFQQEEFVGEMEMMESKLEVSGSTSAVEKASASNDEDASLDDVILDDAASVRPEDPSAMDDWTRERIRNIISSRAKVQADQQLAIPKEKPDIRDNAVFKKYKDGTLVPQQAQVDEPKQLPPFPSREHAIGFWKVVRSPTGFDVEEGDESRSDNLVLRVDGTVAGGPILDQETRQKASGGTWKLLGTTPDDARIRIRLAIPPKKERILVMEGKLERISFSSDIPLARGTFGIPALELLADKADSQLQDLLHCSGSVMIEDSVTGNNRIDIGKFSLTKLNTPTDPKQFTVTVPRPVGFQD